MHGNRFVGGCVIGVLLALVFGWHSTRLAGQALQRSLPDIQSLTEPGEGLSIRQKSAETGLASFASTDGRGVLLAISATAPAEARARNFMAVYGSSFGVTDNSELALQRAVPADTLGVEHVRFQQMHLGLPVVAAEIVVHLRGARVVAVNGLIVKNLPVTVAATIPSADARRLAVDVVAKLNTDLRDADVTYSDPTLEILDKSVFEPTFVEPRATWFVVASGPGLREFIWVDAETGAVLHHYSQLTDAKSRTVYTAGNASTLPGTLVRSEGGAPTGDADADHAYDYAGATYDYYLSQHGRDSYDAAGATIRSSVHYCPNPCLGGYQNAFWDGSQMVYGNGFSSADDVVAHELTHAVTERSANLVYSRQPGALNESFSDIFGETVDLTDSYGNDAPSVRWQLGEDLSIGAIRNLYNPDQYGQPAKLSDATYACSASDNGGVHTNSGIPNHAYALMVDGGTYNGRSVSGIGLTKAGKIEYRALTNYLTSAATFLDDYNAVNQSCSDLIGTAGITAADCTQVKLALDAVEMNQPPTCGVAVPPPPLCPTNTPPARTVFFDGFENPGSGMWTSTSTTTTNWDYAVGGKTGTYALLGPDPTSISDHRAFTTSGIAVPDGARLYFDSAFDFESTSTPYDGGVLEYSIDGGTNWIDGGSLIEAGQAYNGTIVSTFGNPLGSRRGFAFSSLGYTGTRLNLATLARQTAKFRFRVGSDVSIGAPGWSVDNVTIYQCEGSSNAPPAPFGKVSPPDGARVASSQATLTWQPSAGATRYEYCLSATGGGTCGGVWQSTADLTATVAISSSPNTPYFWQVRAVNSVGTTQADAGTWWSFIAGGTARVNVAAAAAGGRVLASSEHSAGYAASGAINGDRAGVNWGNGGGWNDGTPGAWPDYLQVAFTEPRLIDEVDVFSVQDNYQAPVNPTLGQTFSLYGLTDFWVQTWSGTQWVTVPGGVISGNRQVWRRVTFPPMMTTGFRIFVTGALTTWSRITEVEAYTVGTAESPAPFGKITPADGATISPNLPATLTWQASVGATRYEYCVYTTSPTACDGAWLSTTNLEAEVGPLSGYLTHHWQVRAVNTAGTTLADEGNWWSFYPGDLGRVNVAAASAGGRALASSEHSEGYAASGAINGDRAGLNWGYGGGWNDGTPNAWPDYLQVAFTAPRLINEVDVFSVQDDYQSPIEPTLGQTFSLYGLTDFWVQTWSGTQWVTVPGGVISGNTQVWRQVTFPPVLTTNIRIFVNGALTTWSRIAEVEAYSVAPSQPPSEFGKVLPTNGATGQPSPYATLIWDTTAGATHYEYCVDTTNDDACDGSWVSTPSNGAMVSFLSSNTVYYWQVRAVNAAGATPADNGTWWSFSTGSGAVPSSLSGMKVDP